MTVVTDLTGKVALVTGASRGIGAATVRALQALGAEVIGVSRAPYGEQPDAPDQAEASDHRVHRISGDVGDWASIEPAVKRALAEHPHVDILVNCAGVPGRRVPVWELEPDLFRRALAVNTLGPFHLMKLLLPGMIERRSGVVINVVSGAATRPRPTRAMYGTSKAALEHMTFAVADEVTEAGVRVYAFHPGMVDTALFASTRTSAAARAEVAEARRTGELQEPAEPAAAIAFLATPAGADWRDVAFPWRDPVIRAQMRELPGFPTIVPTRV
jgi:NAD(P)-dependent dehydrogenase (short-subunit alcohol dehydrogenase family)